MACRHKLQSGRPCLRAHDGHAGPHAFILTRAVRLDRLGDTLAAPAAPLPDLSLSLGSRAGKAEMAGRPDTQARAAAWAASRAAAVQAGKADPGAVPPAAPAPEAVPVPAGPTFQGEAVPQFTPRTRRVKAGTPGRRPVVKADKQSECVMVRLTPSERSDLAAAADLTGVALGAFARAAVLAAVAELVASMPKGAAHLG